MADREKAISGLKYCLDRSKEKVHCGDCPYWQDDFESGCHIYDMIRDALALLKEQEARVMTEGDVLHSTGKPIWFESRGMYLSKRGFWIMPFEVDPELHIRFVQSVTGGKITLSLFDYGKIWRCWTSRPSEKRMRDTKWEGEKE